MSDPSSSLTLQAASSSYKQVEAILARPLVSSIGPLSKLLSHAVENTNDPSLIRCLVDDLAGFSRALTTQWRQLKFSEVDAADESGRLAHESEITTFPRLWNLLKTALFATVIVLVGVLKRTLGDRSLAADACQSQLMRHCVHSDFPVAPVVASQVLHTLRHFYFITKRLRTAGFSQHRFVYLTAIDILSLYPANAEAFLRSIAPPQLGRTAQHPLDRTLDLFFLNTAEHYALVLTPVANEELLVASAVPYLAAGRERHMIAVFEAAHCVMLSVLSAPHSAETTVKQLPFYVDALFNVFPEHLSSRQFRLAFKTLVRVTAPPSKLSDSHPHLPAVLMELVHDRALRSSTAPLPEETAASLAGANVSSPPLSERAVLALALVDALPFLPVLLMEEWLPLCAELVGSEQDTEMRITVRDRFWEVLISGEMDSERSGLAVAWWTSQGGRELVLDGKSRDSADDFTMNGALPPEGTPRGSKI